MLPPLKFSIPKLSGINGALIGPQLCTNRILILGCTDHLLVKQKWKVAGPSRWFCGWNYLNKYIPSYSPISVTWLLPGILSGWVLYSKLAPHPVARYGVEIFSLLSALQLYSIALRWFSTRLAPIPKSQVRDQQQARGQWPQTYISALRRIR